MLTTSQRIALRFALTIAGIVLFLGIVINLAFFASRRKREQQQFAMKQFAGPENIFQMQKMQRKFARMTGGELGPRNMLVVVVDSAEHKDLDAHTIFANLVHIEDERYVYGMTPDANQVLVVDITPIVNNQIALLWITLVVLIVTSGCGYFIAVYTVKKGLRDLHILAEQVTAIDIDTLQHTWTFDHLPAHDEINIVSRALDEMTKKLHSQIYAIKQFVANVSHEFKTPLMALQSTLEIGGKTKQWTHILPHVREEIGVMHRLLDTLTTLTRAQNNISFETTKLTIAECFAPLVAMMQQKYPTVSFVQSVDPSLTKVTHQGFLERIVSNLLDNAGKFTHAGGTVTIHADQSCMIIADTGSGIAPAYMDTIWEPFWQGDEARETQGFGLGLALVKQLVTLLDWDIVIKSTVGEGTTVTIYW